jgi:hypothetical protein
MESIFVDMTTCIGICLYVKLTSFEKETFSKAVAEGIQLLKQMIIQVSELF